MLFSSLLFLAIFFPCVLFVYFVLLRSRNSRNTFLVFASLLFYGWGEPRFVFVMLLSIMANYLLGLWVHQLKLAIDGRRTQTLLRLVLLLTVILNLSLLFYCKYVDFFIGNVNFLFGLALPLQEIVLPIGISFFTFQAMSYVFDVYADKGTVQKNPLKVALYISFFPQLIAGPIVRYETIAKQIDNRQETLEDFALGTRRFILGMAKKVLLANTLATIADKAFSFHAASELSVSFAFLGAVAYSLQIYYDFSGYSDMAIGLGRMFGFHFLENFNYPYISHSISEFWRRWHISLGSWFRDYVYFPLGGSHVHSKIRMVFNLFVVWALTGLWHGAKWTFIGWGLAYFIFIAFEKLTGIPTCFTKSWQRILYRIFTLCYVMGNWILFRADSMSQAFHYFTSLFGMAQNAVFDPLTLLYLQENAIFLVIAILFSMPLLPWAKAKIVGIGISTKQWKAVEILVNVVLLLLFLVCLTYLAKGSYNPFIYFNF